MSTRASSEDDRIIKRPKLFRACAQCVGAKTRCEDVEADGCAVCRRKGKACSLAGLAVPAPHPSASRQSSVLDMHPHTQLSNASQARTERVQDETMYRQDVMDAHDRFIDTLPNYQPGGYTSDSMGMGAASTSVRSSIPPYTHAHGQAVAVQEAGRDLIHPDLADAPLRGAGELVLRMAESEARIRALEQQVTELQSRSVTHTLPLMPSRPNTTHTNSGVVAATPASSRGAIEESTADVPIAAIRRRAYMRFNDALLTITSSEGYPSVISRGWITADQAEMAFHSFKHIVSKQLPLISWIKSTTPPPKHPFIVTAMLHHIPSYQRLDLIELVDESILLAMKGGGSIEVVMALLILSLAPMIPDTSARAVRTRLSPMRCISLAYRMGQEIGLESDLQQTLREAPDLTSLEWAPEYERIELWAAVTSRYSLLHLMQSNRPTYPSFSIRSLPTSARQINPLCFDHLLAEADLIDVGRVTLEPILEIQDEQPHLDVARGLVGRWTEGMMQLRQTTCTGVTSDTLETDRASLIQTLLLRLALIMQCTPSPLGPLRNALLTCMAFIRSSAQGMLTLLVPDPAHPPTRLSCPAYVAQAALLGCMTMIGTVAHIRRMEAAIASHNAGDGAKSNAKPARPAAEDMPDVARLDILVKLLRESNGVMGVILDRVEGLYASSSFQTQGDGGNGGNGDGQLAGQRNGQVDSGRQNDGTMSSSRGAIGGVSQSGYGQVNASSSSSPFSGNGNESMYNPLSTPRTASRGMPPPISTTSLGSASHAYSTQYQHQHLQQSQHQQQSLPQHHHHLQHQHQQHLQPQQQSNHGLFSGSLAPSLETWHGASGMDPPLTPLFELDMLGWDWSMLPMAPDWSMDTMGGLGEGMGQGQGGLG